MRDDQDRPIPARDYTKGLFLGGDSAQALHQRFRTGMDGTGMPAFGPEMSAQDGWNLVYYMRSLRAPAAPVPTDAVAYGRRIVQERQCSACHVIEGRGGDVGPNLDVSATKLHYNWVREFLADPLSFGKVYPYMPYRMPNLNLSAAEIDAIVALFAQIARRPLPEPPDPPARIDESRIADGTLLYFLKCTECHNLGTVVPTPEAKRQGPDLINVSRRLRFEFIRGWVNNPRSINPLARMVDTNLTPEEIEAVTAFVWKTSTEAQARAARR